MNTVVDNHQRRIELLEMMMHERKQDNRRDHDMIDSRINRLNNSITRFYKSFDDHHAESIDVFDFIDEKFTEFNNRIAGETFVTFYPSQCCLCHVILAVFLFFHLVASTRTK